MNNQANIRSYKVFSKNILYESIFMKLNISTVLFWWCKIWEKFLEVYFKKLNNLIVMEYIYNHIYKK